MANIVHLKARANTPFIDEKLAAGVITPGMLVERSSATQVQAHSTAAGPAAKLFADVNPEIGRGLDTDYAIGDQVKLIKADAGEEVNALVAAGATAITAGAPLVSAGDGTVQTITVDATTVEGALVGFALEAVDNSGGGSAVRIRMEVA